MPPLPPQGRTVPQAGSGERVLIIRRRRRLRQLKFFVATLVLIALLVGYFTGAFYTPLTRIGDWFTTVRLALSAGPALPQPHGLENPKAVYAMGSGAVVLGERETVLYAPNGAELRRVPHGYDRPSVTAGDTRVCIYNRSGKQLMVESRTSSLFQHSMKDSILMAKMSNNGALAVATKSELSVFDDAMQQVWSWKNTGETTLAMDFSPNEKNLAVATLYPQDGAVGAQLYFFDTRSNAQGVQVVTAGGLPLQVHYLSGSRVAVVYDTYVATYDPADGAQTARYDYGQRMLQSASVHSSGKVALLFGGGDYANVTTLVLLDQSLAETSLTTRAMRTRIVQHGGDAVYLLSENSVHTFGADGVYYGETQLEEPLIGLADAGKLLAGNTRMFRFTPPPRPRETS